jgi:hypothetical protein
MLKNWYAYFGFLLFGFYTYGLLEWTFGQNILDKVVCYWEQQLGQHHIQESHIVV